MTARARRALTLLALAAAGVLAPLAPAHAGALRFCGRQLQLTPAAEDRVFRFADIVKRTLGASGGQVAIVSRSGLDLGRFGIRYSHAGLALRASPQAPWSIRQLYFACDEGRPRLFDQGMSGFLLGADDPEASFLSVVVLPPEAGAPVEAAALDNPRALALLHGTYSANAWAWGDRYQNCNQWLVELLGDAWAPAAPARHEAGADPGQAGGSVARARARDWLREAGYRPSRVQGGPYAPLALAIPHLHVDDHPLESLHQGVFEVSMPASIEDFVHARLPAATRVEFCHAGDRVVVHRGWDAIPAGCVAAPGDEVHVLD